MSIGIYKVKNGVNQGLKFKGYFDGQQITNTDRTGLSRYDIENTKIVFDILLECQRLNKRMIPIFKKIEKNLCKKYGEESGERILYLIKELYLVKRDYIRNRRDIRKIISQIKKIGG